MVQKGKALIMDDLGNIIYILFVLVSLIGAAWRNYTKKKEEQQERQMTREVLEEERQDDNESLFRPEELVLKEQEAQLRLEQLEQKAKAAIQDRRLKRRNLLEQNALKAERAEEQNEFEFDPKKAIIYSEILNPPYI